MKDYSTLSQQQKNDLITDLYIDKNKSFAEIASSFNTYPNKILRDAKNFGIPIRNKSDAQKVALKTGKHKHPTKGKKRSDKVKDKIGKGVMDAWENLDEKTLKQRQKKAKRNWEKLSDDQKQYMQKKATDAVREASKVGSKLEHYLLNKLLEDGHIVNFHKEHSLVTTKLQIDLFLPNLNIAIEVDGPSHFSPVWGDDVLKRNISYDRKKEGLIIGKGWHLIRIKQNKDFSKSRSNVLYSKLSDTIDKLKNSSLATAAKSITLED